MVNQVQGKGKFTLNKDYSKISVYVNERYGSVTDDEVKDIMMKMAKPYLEIDEEPDGTKIISLAVTSSEYKENTDKYIKFLEETLDALGVTVHKDVKGEIYLGSKGVDPSAK